jgi:hypothetical protein
VALPHSRRKIHPAHQSPQAHLGLQFYLEKKMKNIRPHNVTIRTKPIVYMAWTVGENPLDGHYCRVTKTPPTIRTKRIPAWKSPTLQRR